MQELKKTSELQHQLPELLSRPVQRILEYKLLLKVLPTYNFFMDIEKCANIFIDD